MSIDKQSHGDGNDMCSTSRPSNMWQKESLCVTQHMATMSDAAHTVFELESASLLPQRVTPRETFNGWAFAAVLALLVLLTISFGFARRTDEHFPREHQPPMLPEQFSAFHNIVTHKDVGREWYSWPLRAFRAEVGHESFFVCYGVSCDGSWSLV